jgi:hypothetical protein
MSLPGEPRCLPDGPQPKEKVERSTRPPEGIKTFLSQLIQ